VFVLFLVVCPRLPGLWIFLKVIKTRPRLADQGWSGPRFFITFKKIHNPGNFGRFVLFLVVRPKVARIMDVLKSYSFRFCIVFSCVAKKWPGFWIFLKVIKTRPRLADQGWSGPRLFITFKKIHNPGNFGLFVLFLVVRPQVARIMDFL